MTVKCTRLGPSNRPSNYTSSRSRHPHKPLSRQLRRIDHEVSESVMGNLRCCRRDILLAGASGLVVLGNNILRGQVLPTCCCGSMLMFQQQPQLAVITPTRPRGWVQPRCADSL